MTQLAPTLDIGSLGLRIPTPTSSSLLEVRLHYKVRIAANNRFYTHASCKSAHRHVVSFPVGTKSRVFRCSRFSMHPLVGSEHVLYNHNMNIKTKRIR